MSTPERTRNVPSSDRPEGEDGEQHGPALQRVALLHHDRGMQQRGADEPRHERGVLDRVPEPQAAPAELVVGPPAAQRDADGERAPGGQRPGPHPARPGRHRRGPRSAPRRRRRTPSRTRHSRDRGTADGRRGRGPAAAGSARALDRRGIEAQERVRGEQDEGEEPDADHALHRQHAGAQRRRQVARRKRRPASPNSARISTHSSIEPSWLPQTPVIL